jgi:hypothetical protein
VRGSTIVDGPRRIVLDADNAFLLGVSGDDYVVWASTGGRRTQVWRVSPTGTVRVLLRAPEAFNAVLSADGDRIALPRTRVDARETTVTVHDAVTGKVEETTTFNGFATVLDLDGDEAVVGTLDPDKTLLWHVPSGMRERIAGRRGYAADLAADRLAVLTGDPFRGGCSVVSTLDEPSQPLSRSCTERVYAFAPGGARMALVDLLTDGLGPSRVTVRRVGGREVASYDAPLYFGMVTWETSRALLLETNGPKRAALVRCRGTDCERASKLGRTPEVRPVAHRFTLAAP